jgi:hypothetical protein
MTSAANENIMLDSPAGCLSNYKKTSYRSMSLCTYQVTMEDLLALEKGVEYETSVGESVDRERMRLLYTASIGHTSLAHLWVANVVIRSISPTILVIGANVCGRRVRKVVVDFGAMRDGGFYTRAEEDARISTSLFSNSATLSFRIPSACCDRKETTCSSYQYRNKLPISDSHMTKNPDLGPTYTHLPVIKRIDMFERINGGCLVRNIHGSLRIMDRTGGHTHNDTRFMV